MTWPQTRIGNVCRVIPGYAFKSADFTQEGIPVIKISNITDDYRVDLADVQYWPNELFDDKLTKYQLHDGDIVLAMTGATAGKIGRVRSEQTLLLNQRVAKIQAVDADADFLWTTLSSPTFRELFYNLGAGAAQPNMSGGQIEAVEIPFPPRRIQQKIGSIRRAYDDLIENNRRRMALLEESARLLYQEWFVRFRFPGHEHARIVNGLPEGWRRKALSEVAEFRLGKMLDQNKNKGDLMPYLANVNVRWGEFELNDLREMRFEDHELETFGLKYGDIVMCEGGEPGRCAIWKDQLPGMMIQKAIHRIRCRDNMHHVYLYYSLRHKGQSGHLATLFTGATIKHLPREKLEKVTIVTPPARLMDRFTEQVGPIEGQLKLLEATNRRASEARDLLLPRLMSGEVTA